MNYDKTCIKSDVCDMAVCDYTLCRHGFWIDNLKKKFSNVPEGQSLNAVLADVGERLLPCPFCGHEKTVIISADTVCYVACEKKHCQTEGPTKTTREDAINAWNKRANVS